MDNFKLLLLIVLMTVVYLLSVLGYNPHQSQNERAVLIYYIGD